MEADFEKLIPDNTCSPGNTPLPPQLRTELSQVHCPWEIACNSLNTQK